MPPIAPYPLWFVLGREPLLSFAEILSVTHTPITGSATLYTPPIARLQTTHPASTLMSRLGGTIKIGQEVASALSEPELLSAMIRELGEITGKINFGISFYTRTSSSRDIQRVAEWGKKIKNELKNNGRSVRYIFKNELVLSSVTVSMNGLTRRGKEFLIMPDGKKFALATTEAVQPFEQFSQRDYGRPGRDDHSGMLPPKLALMMLNLTGIPKNASILDPFCGSGTILTEALLQGYTHITGSDISKEAINDSKQNIAWIKEKSTELVAKTTTTVFESDVTLLTKHLKQLSVDAIVSEPYLGPPLHGNEPITELQKNADQLTALYEKAFHSFVQLLAPGGVVVFVIPRFKTGETWVTISDLLIPSIKNLGVTPERLVLEELQTEYFLLYHRPGQQVGREIWKLRKNDS